MQLITISAFAIIVHDINIWMSNEVSQYENMLYEWNYVQGHQAH